MLARQVQLLVLLLRRPLVPKKKTSRRRWLALLPRSFRSPPPQAGASYLHRYLFGFSRVFVNVINIILVLLPVLSLYKLAAFLY